MTVSEKICCSVTSDGMLNCWDARVSKKPTTVIKVNTHAVAIAGVSWNSVSPNLILTGDTSGELVIFDRRKFVKNNNVHREN